MPADTIGETERSDPLFRIAAILGCSTDAFHEKGGELSAISETNELLEAFQSIQSVDGRRAVLETARRLALADQT